MKNILVIGGTSVDTIVQFEQLPAPVPQTLFAPSMEAMGSTGSGKILALSNLNVPCKLHTIFGDDSYGEKIKSELQAANVEFVYDLDPQGTERHINLMDNQGGRISIFTNCSSADLTLNLERLETLIQEADLIVLNIMGYTKQLIPIIKKYNKPVWTDLHDYSIGKDYYDEFIEVADVIFLSSDNLDEYQPVMKQFESLGKSLVVCTHGKQGATALKDGEFEEVGIIESYPFVDSNGAGDNFFVGYLYGYLNEEDMKTSLAYATICGGLAISSPHISDLTLTEEKLKQEYQLHFSH